MDWIEQLKNCWIDRNDFIVNDKRVDTFQKLEQDAHERKIFQLRDRNVKIVKATSRVQIGGFQSVDGKDIVRYGIHHQWLMKQKEHFYIEERIEERKAMFQHEQLIEDCVYNEKMSDAETKGESEEEIIRSVRFSYNRLQAVQYAERWWNDYNPAYRKFDVDCTNYVSQCLHAGGAPMRGYSNRSQGWWYQNDTWSYSWAVAHALRWYLGTSKAGLQANEVNRPEHLELGDVICYDFDGDGKWQHNTIVVAKDQNNMPLVNAHTTNSRMRYWAYEDSTAYTDQIQYKFFHIRDG
ncbi:amidase domain-containing protein [Pueribacillus sp. YX66]|uniref:amidase domain-containing protein n=1 Tax=Pueribacillus sp. YX66 TaxID=3229242 RepID=UPI00358CEC0B